jgi:iron-sulfur cluster assembly accessory protein
MRSSKLLEVTADAQRKLQEVIERSGQPEALVRIAAVRGPHGCIHGWRLGLEGDARPEDTTVRTGDVSVLVDAELTEALEGAVVDYREDASHIGFTIEAPAAASGHGHAHGNGGCAHGHGHGHG